MVALQLGQYSHEAVMREIEVGHVHLRLYLLIDVGLPLLLSLYLLASLPLLSLIWIF